MVASVDALVPHALIRLPGEDRAVTIVQAQGTASGQFWTVVFRDQDGRLGEVTLSLEDLSSVDLVERQQGLSFTGNAKRFSLGVEATRIQVGFQHDMAALAVSNIAPLPHQLEAVYS